MINRRKTRKIFVGNVMVGANSPITVQTMTNTNTENVKATLQQIEGVASIGADIVRVSCPNMASSATALREIVKNSPIPIIADVHFNYKRAIEAIESGAHCIRINPGNILDYGLKEIANAANNNNVSIRLGINSGSIPRDILEKHKEPSVDAIIETAILNIKKFEDMGFYNFKISVKSSDVNTSIAAYRKLSEISDYPLHIGITEAGTLFCGTIKSAIGIGTLLADGIGDTLRVSLSLKDIREEVKVGRQILKSLDLLGNTVNIVACPTCARTLIDVVAIATELEKITGNFDKTLRISVLGCVVNGPGEAINSDIGIFGFKKGIAKIYKDGTEIKTCAEENIVEIVGEIVSAL
ncbi:MAG: flavodoxin-dependent (E)-4-hydroxy-3-methylbut-2-enyl-diphosphate synthase [Holosporales bacterium]|jgi:(E)-4-hydroxy-3-methylbut-2-enyl-diphosphate synthase|nr:flavodoxin-dependent (E)-4-hydroxy-3-methylbut-2-enyl-diphosphate synthase [Holosporales bacterium]